MVQLNNKISVMRHLIYRFVFEIFFRFRNLKAQIISEMSPTRLFENFRVLIWCRFEVTNAFRLV